MWYVVKSEWGYWTSDLEPFADFDEACQAAKNNSHMNVVHESLYNIISKLPPARGNLKDP